MFASKAPLFYNAHGYNTRIICTRTDAGTDTRTEDAESETLPQTHVETQAQAQACGTNPY